MSWNRLNDQLKKLRLDKMMTTKKPTDYLSTTPTTPGTTPSSTSQPDSLDLDYDMWQGQFEFVGPLNNSTNSNINEYQTSSPTTSSSLEDLRFNNYIPPDQPVLIDEETFLSLHPNDFPSSGPQSGLYLDDYNNLDSPPPFSPLNNSNNNFFSNNNSKILNNKTNNLISTVEEKNVKNNLINNNLKLINENPELSNKLILKTNSGSKLNGLIAKTDFCDSLNEQVSINNGVD